jgi:hypothetical protein
MSLTNIHLFLVATCFGYIWTIIRQYLFIYFSMTLQFLLYFYRPYFPHPCFGETGGTTANLNQCSQYDVGIVFSVKYAYH